MTTSLTHCPTARPHNHFLPVAENVITVGSEGRAKILASLLDADESASGPGAPTSTDERRPPSPIRSTRGFITYTGRFNGVPVSIIMINMGYPNMDFFVRELREATRGPLRIIRLGSCAGLRPDLPVGTVTVASQGSIFVRQNPDAWAETENAPESSDETGRVSVSEREVEPYTFHKVAPADEQLSARLQKELESALGSTGGKVVGCLNVTADSFYSSQGGYRGRGHGNLVTLDACWGVRDNRIFLRSWLVSQSKVGVCRACECPALSHWSAFLRVKVIVRRRNSASCKRSYCAWWQQRGGVGTPGITSLISTFREPCSV